MMYIKQKQTRNWNYIFLKLNLNSSIKGKHKIQLQIHKKTNFYFIKKYIKQYKIYIITKFYDHRLILSSRN